MVGMWLTATAFFGMAYFVSGKRVRVEEAIVFTLAFANAATVSAVITLAIGAKRRWALEAALPMAALMFDSVAIAWAFSWLAPGTSWNLQTVDFFPYGRHVPTVVLGIARQTIPTGAIVGASFGFLVGLSILLVRNRPRLARCLVAALLLACVIGSVHVVAFDHVVDFIVKTRLAGVNVLKNYNIPLPKATAFVIWAAHQVIALVYFILVVLGVDWFVLESLSRRGEIDLSQTWSTLMFATPMVLIALTLIAVSSPFFTIDFGLSG
jgi:hypothetical protein